MGFKADAVLLSASPLPRRFSAGPGRALNGGPPALLLFPSGLGPKRVKVFRVRARNLLSQKL